MKRNTKIATILTLSAVGAALAAGPVSAAVSDTGSTPSGAGSFSRMMGTSGGTTTSPSRGTSMMGAGTSGNGGMMGGNAAGMMGRSATGTTMMGAGGAGMMGTLATTAPSGTLSAAQKTALAQIAEQQQLTQNLFQAFADRYSNLMFDHLADAAAAQRDTLRTLLSRYGVSDPTTGKSAGTFSDPATQATYNRLLAQGQVGYSGALAAAHALSAAQVKGLTGDLAGVSAPDVQQVYTQLLTRAEMYQAMFTSPAQ